MLRIILMGMCALTLSISAHAQDVKYCGQVEETEKIFQRFPQLRVHAEQANQQLVEEEVAYRSSGGDDQLLIIPIVFHIIHDNGPENISDEQIYSAMEVLNRDFRLLNEDVGDVVDEFQDLPSDITIEFRLAKRDPNGVCTKGINRIESSLTYQGDSQMKSLIFWPREMYMNVWVCADAGGAAGYTFLPSSVDNPWMEDEDGIVLLHDYTGDMGTSNVFRSRTLTHEVGHWLNLSHPWGPTNSPGVIANCDTDDGVDDTPLTVGWTSCILDGESCGSIDNVQNYMDYSYCSRMFTPGQRSRMRTAAFSSIAERNNLWSEQNLEDTGVFEESVLCQADFNAERVVICAGDSIQLNDYSYHNIAEWSWDFGSFTVEGSDEEEHKNPTVAFEEPGTYSVTLTVSDGTESVSATKNNYIRVLPSDALEDPFVDSFEDGINENEWFIYNEHDNVTWEETSITAYTGSSCIRIRNRNNAVEMSNDELTSSTIDLTNAVYATVSYRWAYCNLPDDTDDRIKVSVSKDCGDSWALRKVHRGFTDLPTADPQNAPFVPSGPDEWAENTIIIDNPDFLVDGFRVKFDFEGRGGNHVYMDDINIDVVYEVDLSVNDIASNFTYSISPNPADQNAQLRYYLPANTDVNFALLDMTGRQVQQLFEGSASKGENTIQINRNHLASGVYLLRMHIGDYATTERFVLR